MSIKKPTQIGQAGTAGQSTAPSVSPDNNASKLVKEAHVKTPVNPTDRQTKQVFKELLKAGPIGSEIN